MQYFKPWKNQKGTFSLAQSAIQFNQPLALSDEFSAVKYSAVPRLKLSELCLSATSAVPVNRFTHSGRAALAAAGQLLHKENSIILVPCYHCPAAIEPFIWLGYQCLFYRVNSDLSPDQQHVQQLLQEHNVTHCLSINYFGVICHLDKLKALTSGHDIAMIHDCAHALFKLIEVNTDALAVDAVICSINKILPSIDGGILLLKQQQPSVAKIDSWTEFKAFIYVLGITDLINKCRSALSKPNEATNVSQPSETVHSQFRYFEPSQMSRRCFSHTILMLNHSDLTMISRKRRHNYNVLMSMLKQVDCGHVLQTDLAPEDVPYVLPFLLNDKNDFTKVRQAGVQCLRWEETAMTDCAISQDYRHRLIQLPCHHQLTMADITAIIQILKAL